MGATDTRWTVWLLLQRILGFIQFANLPPLPDGVHCFLTATQSARHWHPQAGASRVPGPWPLWMGGPASQQLKPGSGSGHWHGLYVAWHARHGRYGDAAIPIQRPEIINFSGMLSPSNILREPVSP